MYKSDEMSEEGKSYEPQRGCRTIDSGDAGGGIGDKLK